MEAGGGAKECPEGEIIDLHRDVILGLPAIRREQVKGSIAHYALQSFSRNRQASPAVLEMLVSCLCDAVPG